MQFLIHVQIRFFFWGESAFHPDANPTLTKSEMYHLYTTRRLKPILHKLSAVGQATVSGHEFSSMKDILAAWACHTGTPGTVDQVGMIFAKFF